MLILNLEMQDADTALKGEIEGNHKASAVLLCPWLSPAAFARFGAHEALSKPALPIKP